MYFKPVVTLDEPILAEAVLKLWHDVITSTRRPDLVVGIATGGLICARYLQEEAVVMEVALRRAGTGAKQRSGVASLLRRLPYAITDRLRQVEDFHLERRSRAMPADSRFRLTPQLRLDAARIGTVARQREFRSVLVLDDAVDSGTTLGCVVMALREELPEGVNVVSAVLTHTRPDPAFRADFALYDGVLCRFPWSFDYRGR